VADQEFALGYRDGRNPGTPEPGENRSPAYLHSFKVGRAEIEGNPIHASVSREAAEVALAAMLNAVEG
jgi:hypothetical protein